MHILPYFSAPAEFHPYDPQVVEVAGLLREAIQKVGPRLRVEHVGSTAVPGCGGKGVVDLAVLYPEGLLARARDVLDGLGFQKQGGREPWPEDRPMRVGSVAHHGRTYRIHAHVIALDSPEHGELIWFRDTLRRQPALMRQYEAQKRAILQSGITDSLDYSNAKGNFIIEALKGRDIYTRE